ncbi:hypothetical protein GCM10009846_07210 [Agrococcus versicolor]|uniref:Uncharacterized protein n=1 Tax=Agrococcus versicolor TaxID=501482 RepID=A0ABP5MB13_9MICO
MVADPLALTLSAIVAGVVVVVLAIVVWQVLAVRRVRRAAEAIAAERDRLATARTAHAQAQGSSPAEVASANDRVQEARRAVNAAVREGEALRKRFPTSLYAGRIPAPEYEEAGGGTAEPPRIAF